MTTQELVLKIKDSNKFSNISISEKEIGFRLNRQNSFTFYWFGVIGNECYFSHKYSQNTGKSTRSLRSAWNVLHEIGYFN
jgi:hypothetical protein